MNGFLEEPGRPSLPHVEREILEAPITVEELYIVLAASTLGKASGLDSFSFEI